MRLLGACRLSLDTDASTSIARQRESIEREARRRGGTLMALVEDTDTSGVTSCFVRQNLGPWLTDPGLIDQYDAVAVARLARISRSLLGFAELLEWLQARGKSLISVAENLDFTTPHGRMMVSILIVFAAFEREQLAARRREAAVKLRSMARWGGGHAPFGYRPVALDDGGFDLVPDPATVPIVEYLAGQVIAGRSVNSLARELTERRIPTPQGHRRWGTEVLLRMLASPVLRGYITTTKPGGEPEIVRGSDGMPVTREPVLGDTTWAALQAALEKTRQPRYGNRRDASLLLRIAFCGLCGAPLYQDRHKPRNKVYNYYSCRDRRDGCKLPGLPMNALEELVEEILLDELGEVPMRTKVHHPAQDSADQIRLAEESREALEEQFMAGQLSAESFARMTTRLEARQETLRQIPSRPATTEWSRQGSRSRNTGLSSTLPNATNYWSRLGSEHMRGMMLAASQKVARGLEACDYLNVTTTGPYVSRPTRIDFCFWSQTALSATSSV